MYTLRVHRLMVYMDIRRILSQTVAPTRSAEFLLKRDRYSAPLVDISVETRHKRCSTLDRYAVKVSHKRDAGP
jgi:hypothetical protein